MGKVIRCKNKIIQASERVRQAAATRLPSKKELHPQDIVTSTSPRDRDISEES